MTIPYCLGIYASSTLDFFDLDAGESAVAGGRSAQAIIVVHQDFVVVAPASVRLGLTPGRDFAVRPVPLAVTLRRRTGAHAFPQLHLGDDGARGGGDLYAVAGFQAEVLAIDRVDIDDVVPGLVPHVDLLDLLEPGGFLAAAFAVGARLGVEEGEGFPLHRLKIAPQPR